MGKCDNCKIRQRMARAFDLHWLGEDDCPYEKCPMPDMSVCERCTENHNCAWQNHEETICKEKPAFPQTNYDLLIIKTPEELAEFLKEQTSLAHNYGYECADGEPDFPDGLPANYDYLTWLKKEAKE